MTRGGLLDGLRLGIQQRRVRMIELKTGRLTKLKMHAVTDWNGPQWVSDGEILINRYN